MSSPTITPNQDSQASSVNAESPTPSTLGQVLAPQGPPTVDASQAQPTQPQSRLTAILHAVASVGSTALAGIPDKGRATFVTGLGQGARQAQADEANQQAIKFKTFDDQVRAAQLHAQDLELQNHTQAQADAHQAAQDAQHDWDETHGLQYDEIPNTGQAVTDHLTAQTTGNGAATIPPGTHLSADGKSILIPRQSDDTQTAQLTKYNAFRTVFGLPQLPQGAQFVPSKFADMLQNRMEGHALSGDVYNHDTLPVAIADLQSNRDAYAGSKDADASVLKVANGTIKSMQAKLDYLDNHANTIKQQAAEASQNTPQGQATLAKTKAETAKIQAEAQKTADNTELNAVAFDPNYQNPDGSKGANVVMSKNDASAKGLTHYKADPQKLNALVAGFNDVQNKLNNLADVATDPNKMNQVQAGVAAAMLEHGSGIKLEGGLLGVHADTSRINEELYKDDVKSANQATRDYVTAALGAHEAITQLPRLQTFGQSSRMTQQQMEAAVRLLPQPGDGAMAAQKMTSLQGMLDPLRKQVPHMPGADTIPSWLEKRQQMQQRTTLNSNQQSNLAQFVSGLK